MLSSSSEPESRTLENIWGTHSDIQMNHRDDTTAFKPVAYSYLFQHWPIISSGSVRDELKTASLGTFLLSVTLIDARSYRKNMRVASFVSRSSWHCGSRRQVENRNKPRIDKSSCSFDILTYPGSEFCSVRNPQECAYHVAKIAQPPGRAFPIVKHSGKPDMS
jgi:hypothetical protein